MTRQVSIIPLFKHIESVDDANAVNDGLQETFLSHIFVQLVYKPYPPGLCLCAYAPASLSLARSLCVYASARERRDDEVCVCACVHACVRTRRSDVRRGGVNDCWRGIMTSQVDNGLTS